MMEHCREKVRKSFGCVGLSEHKEAVGAMGAEIADRRPQPRARRRLNAVFGCILLQPAGHYAYSLRRLWLAPLKGPTPAVVSSPCSFPDTTNTPTTTFEKTSSLLPIVLHSL